MKVEIWKDIENFSKYQVSNLGRIKSKGRYTKVGIKNQDKCYRKEYIVDGFINKKGYKCLVIDKRANIAGNIYTENIEGINVHKYGAHIFHTSNKEIWEYINQFAEFNNYIIPACI